MNCGLQFSSIKSKAIWFYTKRPEQQITLNEQVLPWSSNEKYQGIQLDSNMTFTYQANCVAAQAKKNIKAMKVMSSFTHILAHILKMSVLCLCSVNLRIWSDTTTTNV